MSKLLTALAMVFSLAGCSMFPGMYMNPMLPSLPKDAQMPDGTDVRIQRITGEVINDKGYQPINARKPGNLVAERLKDLDNYTYRVGPRDVLSVTVWEHPELTIPQGEFRSAEAAGHLVDEEGYMYYPFVGRVQVNGKTVDEIRQILTERLSTYITNPQLDVRVAAYRSKRAYVVGEVNDPGPKPITDIPLTVVEAINQAADVTTEADMQHVTLTRNGEIQYINLLRLYERGNLKNNFILEHGDVLFVPDRNLQKIFVLGEVEEPAALLMHRGRMTLAEALTETGGLNLSTANAGRVYVIRGTPAEPQVFHLNMRSADALILADAFPLQPRDAVFVDIAPLPRWNRAVVEQIMPTLDWINRASRTGFPIFNATIPQ